VGEERMACDPNTPGLPTAATVMRRHLTPAGIGGAPATDPIDVIRERARAGTGHLPSLRDDPPGEVGHGARTYSRPTSIPTTQPAAGFSS
jgi:hypothetical protein